MPQHPVLIAGQWRSSPSYETIHAENPANGEKIPGIYPVSNWIDCDEALTAAAEAAVVLQRTPAEQIAKFLNRYAERIESIAPQLAETANQETGLPVAPRLKDIELPRTTGQFRQAAAAAIDGSWTLPTIDTKLNIRSHHAPIGPVLVIGPNNFPFAFNGIAGGDFAAAIASGNPVIAKAHPSHPNTSRLLAKQAFGAVEDAGLPLATVQLIYQISPENGCRMAADRRLGAVAFTGSRHAGLKLKSAADAVGKPAYMEMSSLNPVVILPGAMRERSDKIADELADSCLAASGQFCTKPGLVILCSGPETDAFVAAMRDRFTARNPLVLLSSGVAKGLATNIKTLTDSGAVVVAGGAPMPAPGMRFANTLLRAHGDHFLAKPEKLQTEAFGNAALFVIARDPKQLPEILAMLDGNLTGTIYSDTQGSDDVIYAALAPILRPRVGRLLNDKMPTGVAVSPAMNHGGPFPSTGHPGFTAVGIPASMRRFTALHCYDNVRANRLPAALANKNPTGQMSRLIDGKWSVADIG